MKEVNPEGRVDIALVRMAERVLTVVESKYEIPGLTKAAMPTVKREIRGIFGTKPINSVSQVLLKKVIR